MIFLVSAVTAEWGFLKHTATCLNSTVFVYMHLSPKEIPLGKLVQHEDVKLRLESLTVPPNKKHDTVKTEAIISTFFFFSLQTKQTDLKSLF